METSTSSDLINEGRGKVITDLETDMEETVVTPDGTGQNGALENDDDPNLNADSQELDEEENFLCTLEKLQEDAEVEEAKAHPTQPHRVEEAPKLLQSALKEGIVKADDSETEEDEKKDIAVDEVLQNSGMQEVETKEEHTHHTHARTNQLQLLLNKAQEYSNFIAADLTELQKSMAEEAQRKAAEAGKKRKGDKDTSKVGSKKSKGAEGAANLKKAQDQHNASLKGGTTKSIFVRPANLNPDCELKDYQLEGVRWLASLYENGVSGILADEMGLGKTIQVISFIAHLRCQKVAGPFMVVAPLATLPNWDREFKKWLPCLPVIRYHGTGPERDAFLTKLGSIDRRVDVFPVIVTSYEMAIKDEKKLTKTVGEFTYLVVDEGQRLKNHRCTLIQSLKRLRAANRLLLSGTPIQNNLDELWSLLNFVNPAIFDDLSVFQSWFGFRDIGQQHRGATNEEAILIEQGNNQTISKLHDILRPFLLRRIKKDVLSDLPPKKEIVVYAGMSKLQAGYADLIEKGVLRDVLIGQGIESGRTLSQTNKQMNHRKNTNHPFLFGEPIDPQTGVQMGTAHPQLLVRASGKFALLDRMLQRLYTDKHQVLIFSQMTMLLNVIEDYLRWRGWNYCRIDGSTKIDERQRQMDVFNAEKTAGENGSRNESDDRHFVFLLSTRAGGLGINLAAADTCIIFDSDWNPHQDSQAMDRCHRIGQTRPVAVYRLLTANSVDIDMMEKQISKKKLERMAIVGGDFRKAGSRSRGEFVISDLSALLESDIKDLHAKGGDVENVKIDDEEFDSIMDRQRLFAEDENKIPLEGKMYDIVEAHKGEVLGALHA